MRADYICQDCTKLQVAGYSGLNHKDIYCLSTNLDAGGHRVGLTQILPTLSLLDPYISMLHGPKMAVTSVSIILVQKW